MFNKNLFFIILCILNLILLFTIFYKYTMVTEGYRGFWSRYYEAAAKKNASRESILQNEMISNEKYQIVQGTIKACGFYFKTNIFNSIYSNITINRFVENAIINNSYGYCFNIDTNNNLYSIINNDTMSYNYKIDVNTKYLINFKIIKNNDSFINCLKEFIQNCNKVSSITYEIDSKNNTVTLSMINDNKIIVYLTTFQDFDEKSTVESIITSNNVNQIKYIDIKIDLTKKYTYGQLYYTNTNYYDCIVMNV